MDDESLAESLKLRANIFPDGRILESRIKRGQDVENSVWQREKTLAHPPADNVFLYKSPQRDFRVVKQIRWQDEIANYRRELHMMERVLREVEYAHSISLSCESC